MSIVFTQLNLCIPFPAFLFIEICINYIYLDALFEKMYRLIVALIWCLLAGKLDVIYIIIKQEICSSNLEYVLHVNRSINNLLLTIVPHFS